VAHQAEAYPGFCSQHEATWSISAPLPFGWDASPFSVTLSIKVSSTHLYTWVERDTVRVKCLAQEQSAMSPARARNRTQSRNKCTNHEATVMH